MERKPDFYLTTAGEMNDELAQQPRACWVRARLKDPVRDDHMLVEINPWLPGQEYGLGYQPITHLLLTGKHEGFSLFPVKEWPCHVYIARLVGEPEVEKGFLQRQQTRIIAWGSIFRTLEEANAYAAPSLSPGRLDVRLEFDHEFDIELDADLPGAPGVGLPVFYFPREAAEKHTGGHLLKVVPHDGAPWLGVFAGGSGLSPYLDFATSCPDPKRLCVVSYGTGWVVRADAPNEWERVPIRPIQGTLSLLNRKLLLFWDLFEVCAYDPRGLKWRTPQLSSDGLELVGVQGERLKLLAHYAPEQRDFEVVVDLETGKHAPALSFPG